MKLSDLLEKIGVRKANAEAPPTELDRNMGALRLSVESIAKAKLSEEERQLLTDETLSQFREAFLGTSSEALLAKAAPPKADEEDEEVIPDDEELEGEDGEGDEKVLDEEKDVPPTKAKKSDTQEEDIMDEQIKKQFEDAVSKAAALEAQLAKSETANADLTTRITKMELENQSRARLAKAETMVRGTTAKAEDIAALLEKLGDDEAATKTVEGLVKSLGAAQSDAQLFQEVGSARAGVTISDQVENAVTELRKSDPTITKEQAIAKVYRSHPEFYTEALNQK